MRDCEKILDQKLGSREFAEAFEATSMEYDFIDRIAAACAKLSKAEKGENQFPNIYRSTARGADMSKFDMSAPLFLSAF